MVQAFRAGGANQSFLGVAVAEVDANRARDLKLKDVYGVEITRIEEDSAASKAGLKVGDVVIEYNGQKVEGNEQFIRLVRETPPGHDVRLLVSRNGAPVNLTAVMGSHRAASSLSRGEAWFDMPRGSIPAHARDAPHLHHCERCHVGH